VSHHVSVRLPDGREATADYRQPVVNVMRRHLQRVMDDAERKAGAPAKVGSPDDLADMALLAEWLDVTPELACDYPPGTGCADHGPAQPDPGFRPAKYVRPGSCLF
jgi:hypothetical protein